MNAPHTAPFTVRSNGASSSTIIGSLPPSSRTTGSNRFAALSAICLPVRSEPVKKILCTAESTNAAPVEPLPCTTSRTPSGNPAEATSRLIASPTSGAYSDGLKTTELPAASAITIPPSGIENGKFHGLMIPTVPSGS